jgi:magnesium transporter
VTAEATDDQEAVAHKMADYDFLAIPVVDHEQHLLGIITHDDILDVLHEEVTEDALLAGAVGPMEQSYLQTHWFTLARHRAGWLAILFVGSLFTALALQHNHETIEEIIWIVLFLPLIISSGGNSGSQSAALILRALSAKEITPSAWLTVVWRELCGGLTLGLFLGVIGFVVGLIFAPSPIDALLLPITLLLVILCGTLVGALLPLLFQRLGLDPALMSTPFVAGIMDIVGIVIYLNIALLLLIRR